jgi:hypothetical protein
MPNGIIYSTAAGIVYLMLLFEALYFILPHLTYCICHTLLRKS